VKKGKKVLNSENSREPSSNMGGKEKVQERLRKGEGAGKRYLGFRKGRLAQRRATSKELDVTHEINLRRPSFAGTGGVEENANSPKDGRAK